MKKERDRDRLVKQRLLNGGSGASPASGMNKFSAKLIPMSHTIDILKSLQKNSSASNISALALMAQQSTAVTNPGKKAVGNSSRGQNKKGSCSMGKGSKKGTQPNLTC